jgi:hypothetical protein
MNRYLRFEPACGAIGVVAASGCTAPVIAASSESTDPAKQKDLGIS